MTESISTFMNLRADHDYTAVAEILSSSVDRLREHQRGISSSIDANPAKASEHIRNGMTLLAELPRIVDPLLAQFDRTSAAAIRTPLAKHVPGANEALRILAEGTLPRELFRLLPA